MTSKMQPGTFTLTTFWAKGDLGVFKGWIDEHGMLATKLGFGIVIVVMKLNQEGLQGHKEWMISGQPVGEVKTVADLHHRRAEMARCADAFIALPGGYGTMEELLEMITRSRLGIHDKSVLKKDL